MSLATVHRSGDHEGRPSGRLKLLALDNSQDALLCEIADSARATSRFDSLAGASRTSGSGSCALADVLHAVGLDQPAVDRCLLVGFGGGGQFGEEVGPVGYRPGVEPCVKLVQDVLSAVQALSLCPGPQVGIPGVTGPAPLLVSLPEPA